MESSDRRSFGWFGLGFAVLWLGGCASAASVADRPGELDLRVEPSASYSVIGRFHLVAVEPRGMGEHDIDLDAETSDARLSLAPGNYVLTLHAGARIVCENDGAMPREDSIARERLVSTRPQRISIEPGEVTTARINFAARTSPHAVEPLGEPESRDPCASVSADAGEQALLSH